MFGVVLWSDTEDQKAVIWCEDHGDLAFYRQSEPECEVSLDAGDWVQFDLTMAQDQRLAHNPRLVAEGLYTDLADRLNSAAMAPAPSAVPVKPQGSSERRTSADIIPFSAMQGNRVDHAPRKAVSGGA